MSDTVIKPPFNQEQFNLQGLNLHTGDLVLFRCKWFPGLLVDVTTRPTNSNEEEVTHVVMVTVEDGIVKGLESAATKLGAGVMVNPLDAVLQDSLETQFPYKFAIRRLQTPLSDQQLKKCQEFIVKHKGIPYNANPIELLRAVMGPNIDHEKADLNGEKVSEKLKHIALEVLRGENVPEHIIELFKSSDEIVKNFFERVITKISGDTDNLHSMFCSELAAAALEYTGVISTDKTAFSFAPRDFGKNSRFEPLKGLEIYGPEQVIFTHGLVHNAAKAIGKQEQEEVKTTKSQHKSHHHHHKTGDSNSNHADDNLSRKKEEKLGQPILIQANTVKVETLATEGRKSNEVIKPVEQNKQEAKKEKTGCKCSIM